MAQGPLRSPRAARNEHQARILRAVVGSWSSPCSPGAGWGVTWLRKHARGARGASPSPRRASLRARGRDAPRRRRDRAPRPRAPPRLSRASSAPTARSRRSAKRLHDGTVEGAWLAAQALRAEAASWKSAERARDRDEQAARRGARSRDVDPRQEAVFPPLREARGEIRWPEALGDYEDLNTRFLTKADATRLTRRIKQFDAIADANHGWIARKRSTRPSPSRSSRRRSKGGRAFDAMLGTRAGKAAREVEIRDLADLRTALPGARFRVFYHLPYLLLVEQDERWEESEEAERVARILLGLRKTFFEVYGQAMGLVPDEQRPVPVVVFTSREAYHHYRSRAEGEGRRRHRGPLRAEGRAPRPPPRLRARRRSCTRPPTSSSARTSARRSRRTSRASGSTKASPSGSPGAGSFADGPDGLPRCEIGLLLRETSSTASSSDRSRS